MKCWTTQVFSEVGLHNLGIYILNTYPKGLCILRQNCVSLTLFLVSVGCQGPWSAQSGKSEPVAGTSRSNGQFRSCVETFFSMSSDLCYGSALPSAYSQGLRQSSGLYPVPKEVKQQVWEVKTLGKFLHTKPSL